MNHYPQLNLRWKAAVIDSIIFSSLLFTTAYFSYDIFPNNLILRIIFIFLPTLSYEPLMLYFTGNSVGHKIYGTGMMQDIAKPGKMTESSPMCSGQTRLKLLTGHINGKASISPCNFSHCCQAFTKSPNSLLYEYFANIQ